MLKLDEIVNIPLCVLYRINLIIKEFSDAPLPWVQFMSSAQDTMLLKEV